MEKNKEKLPNNNAILNKIKDFLSKAKKASPRVTLKDFSVTEIVKKLRPFYLA